MRNLILTVSASALLAACASTAKPPSNTEAAMPAQPPVAAKTTVKPQPARQAAIDPLLDPNSPLAKRAVYFDFDKYDVKDEFMMPLQAHARYLEQNAAKQVRVEGNADERGSKEYNLALGQKRAEATRKVLVSSGARESQIEAISNGKEKPKATAHDEAAWAENRRDDIIYK